MPGLRVCPFSVVVFVATAAVVTVQKRKQQQLSSRQAAQQDVVKQNDELPVFQVVFVLGAPGVGEW